MAPLTVKMVDVRAAHMCSRGTREWARLNGFDYKQFLREGCPIEQVEAVDCEMSRQVCKAARERHVREES